MSSFTLLGVGRVPLRDRRGRVHAYATVDLADFRRVNQYRWHLGSGGYAVRCIPHPDGRQRKFGLHREVMGLTYGDPTEVDHIDPPTKLDNRRENLRLATRGQNAQNLPPIGKTSRYRGVSYARKDGRWWAQAFCGDKKFRQSFREEDAANEAVIAWRRENMPYSTT